MRYIIKYLLEGNGSVPSFVDDGGYFLSGEEIIGISVDATKRHLPNTVEIITKTQLFDRIKLVAPNNINGELRNDQEIMEEVNEFLVSKGLVNYDILTKKVLSIEEIEKLIDSKIKDIK